MSWRGDRAYPGNGSEGAELSEEQLRLRMQARKAQAAERAARLAEKSRARPQRALDPAGYKAQIGRLRAAMDQAPVAKVAAGAKAEGGTG